MIFDGAFDRTHLAQPAATSASVHGDQLCVPIGFLDALYHTRSRSDVLAVYSRWARKLLSAERCAIGFRDDTDHIQFVAADGSRGTPPGASYKLANSMAGTVIAQRRSAFIPDISADPSDGLKALWNAGYKSVALAPLATAESSLGIISVAYKRFIQPDNAELELLAALGRCLGTQLLVIAQIDELEASSITDPLTRLKNRRYFQTAAQLNWMHWIHQTRSFAMVMLDLDHFKVLNDTFGHDAGDVVLQHVARRMEATVQGNDAVIRMGGEEFLVILSNNTLSDATSQADTMLHAIRNAPVPYDDPSLDVTVSIGVSAPMAGDMGYVDILRRADLALYQAKATGRNRVCVLDQDILTNSG